MNKQQNRVREKGERVDDDDDDRVNVDLESREKGKKKGRRGRKT